MFNRRIFSPLFAGMASAMSGGVQRLMELTNTARQLSRPQRVRASKRSRLPVHILWNSTMQGTYVKAKHGPHRCISALMVPRHALRQGKPLRLAEAA